MLVMKLISTLNVRSVDVKTASRFSSTALVEPMQSKHSGIALTIRHPSVNEFGIEAKLMLLKSMMIHCMSAVGCGMSFWMAGLMGLWGGESEMHAASIS